MIWRGTSLRYGTGKKKVNEVDFISQRMELVSGKLATMIKTRVKFNLNMRRRMDLLWDCIVVVKEIVSKLLEEVEVSHFEKEKLEWWFEQDIDDEEEEDEEGEGGSEV
ncbi:hypothetical protein Tco_0714026 [Tanacetum coccineum]